MLTGTITVQIKTSIFITLTSSHICHWKFNFYRLALKVINFNSRFQFTSIICIAKITQTILIDWQCVYQLCHFSDLIIGLIGLSTTRRLTLINQFFGNIGLSLIVRIVNHFSIVQALALIMTAPITNH
jgi:hypothetical protein